MNNNYSNGFKLSFEDFTKLLPYFGSKISDRRLNTIKGDDSDLVLLTIALSSAKQNSQIIGSTGYENIPLQGIIYEKNNTAHARGVARGFNE